MSSRSVLVLDRSMEVWQVVGNPEEVPVCASYLGAAWALEGGGRGSEEAVAVAG